MTTPAFPAPPGARTSARPHDTPLDARLAAAQAAVRARPVDAASRWALFQLLCVTGQGERAVGQLQAYARFAAQHAHIAHAYRDLIRAERFRACVMAGHARPGFVFDAPPWIDDLREALRAQAAGARDEADRARSRALDRAPFVAGRGPDAPFDWIADSDSRFGLVCEVVTAGHDRWLPFSDLAGWRLARPGVLLDLVWAPCVLTLADGSVAHGFMPARYPGSELADGGGAPGASAAAHEADAHESAAREADALRLGSRTAWRDVGRTGVFALGRKTWSTSAGDASLFELHACEFGARARAGAVLGGAAREARGGEAADGCA
ncbi:type VI secretion system accessory protein TagJ [Burkholderia pseudomallei]|uniref:type VI secretion system accessory protein TagJ n=1 Tax=Burkholderia pseudomallei TaxID=28450 RepID=UPI00294A8CF2|nr:type VI secretion system accessory protein TagJ [Burkholderia pseudomallei]CAJ9687414.1 ImpE/SciE family protein [Burkholderia pseudomallei]